MFASQVAGIKHGLAPVTFGHVEPHRAGSVGHVAGEITRHAKTQIIFWQ